MVRDSEQNGSPMPFLGHLLHQILLQFVKLVHLLDLSSSEANLANFKLAMDQQSPLCRSWDIFGWVVDCRQHFVSYSWVKFASQITFNFHLAFQSVADDWFLLSSLAHSSKHLKQLLLDFADQITTDDLPKDSKPRVIHRRLNENYSPKCSKWNF